MVRHDRMWQPRQSAVIPQTTQGADHHDVPLTQGLSGTPSPWRSLPGTGLTVPDGPRALAVDGDFDLTQDSLLPLARTLGPEDSRSRMLRWQRLHEAAGPVARLNLGRLEVRYRPRPGVRAELAELAAAEQICCSFASWSVSEIEVSHTQLALPDLPAALQQPSGRPAAPDAPAAGPLSGQRRRARPGPRRLRHGRTPREPPAVTAPGRDRGVGWFGDLDRRPARPAVADDPDGAARLRDRIAERTWARQDAAARRAAASLMFDRATWHTTDPSRRQQLCTGLRERRRLA